MTRARRPGPRAVCGAGPPDATTRPESGPSPLDGQPRGVGAGGWYAVAAQRVAHQLGERRAGDRATAPAVARVVHHDVDGEPRVVGRGEAGERHGEGAVIAPALGSDPLRGAGLAG